MNARRRVLIGLALTLLLCLTTSSSPRGFSVLGNKWPPGEVKIHLQLGPGAGALIDGAPSWDQVAIEAMVNWNNHLGRLKFVAVPESTIIPGDGTGTNDVFFDSTVFGHEFGDALAITTYWFTADDRVTVETDVVFNNARTWDSYRGKARQDRVDFFRVALHEFGHALGLDHPDETGQTVTALMNSDATGVETLTEDDVAGGQALYGPIPAADVEQRRPQE